MEVSDSTYLLADKLHDGCANVVEHGNDLILGGIDHTGPIDLQNHIVRPDNMPGVSMKWHLLIDSLTQ